ncbi:unnamed protein product [Sphagnum balticum]
MDSMNEMHRFIRQHGHQWTIRSAVVPDPSLAVSCEDTDLAVAVVSPHLKRQYHWSGYGYRLSLELIGTAAALVRYG